MSTLPQLACALQDLLTTTADAIAPPSGFVQRTSPLGGAAFVQTLVFGFLANPAPALEELAQTAATLGVPVSAQALDQRCTPVAATYLEQVLRHALTRVLAAAPVAVPILDRFTAVYLQDSSTIVLPDALRTGWQGCGGTTTTHTAAALKLQVRLELRTGQLDGPHLQHGRSSDHAYSVSQGLPAGSLRLADLGYWSLDEFHALATQQVFWLSRLQAATTVYDATGRRCDVLDLVTA